MTHLQRIRFIRDLIEVALEAAAWTRDNPWNKDYLHVTREKVDSATEFCRPLLQPERR